MAVAFDRRLGEATGTNTVAISTTGIADGEFVVIWVACDNTAGTNLPDVASVTYGTAATQTFTQVIAHDSSSSTAGAATRGFIVIVPSWTTAGNGGFTQITVQFTAAANPAKSVAIAAVFTGVSSTVVASAATNGNALGAAATPTAVGQLVLGMSSSENNVAMTVDTDTTGGAWVEPGGDGSVFTTGGGAAANVAMICAYKIPTSTAAQSWLGGAAGTDGGNAIAVLAEVVAGPSVTQTDTVGLTDTRTFTQAKVLTDTTGLVDARALDQGKVLTDGLGLTDQAIAEIVKTTAVTDSLGLTDQVLVALTKTVTVDDTVGLVDSRVFARTSELTDVVGLVDNLAFVRGLVLTDTVGLVDTVAANVAGSLTVVITDSVGLTDARIFTRDVALTDTVGLVDSLAKALDMVRTDTVGLTDQILAAVAGDKTVIITDNVGLVDSIIVERTAAPIFIFRTPTEIRDIVDDDALPRERNLIRHYVGYRRMGVAVIVWPDLTITERRVLRGDEHLTALAVYGGGRENVIADPAMRALLTAAGYNLIQI